MEALLDYVIKELRDNIIEFLLSGRAVKIEGLGTWTHNIGKTGDELVRLWNEQQPDDPVL